MYEKLDQQMHTAEAQTECSGGTSGLTLFRKSTGVFSQLGKSTSNTSLLACIASHQDRQFWSEPSNGALYPAQSQLPTPKAANYKLESFFLLPKTTKEIDIFSLKTGKNYSSELATEGAKYIGPSCSGEYTSVSTVDSAAVRQSSPIFTLDDSLQKSELPLITVEGLKAVLTQHLTTENIIKISTSIYPEKSMQQKIKTTLPCKTETLYSSNGQVSKLLTTLSTTEKGEEHNDKQDDCSLESHGPCTKNGPETAEQTKLGKELEQRLTGANMPQVLDFEVLNESKYPHRLLIIDNRYHYEYRQGHIKSSINISSPIALRKLFGELRNCLFKMSFMDGLLSLEGEAVTGTDLQNLANLCSQSQTTEELCVPVIIFHCEFSSQRGPNAWRLSRQLDRQANSEEYPRLDFPQTFVLKGGYESFVSSSGELCSPKYSYCSMFSQDHRQDLRIEEARHTEEWRLVRKHSSSL